MQSNHFFNFKRFYHLILSDIALNKKQYLLLIAGSFIAFYAFSWLVISDSEPSRYEQSFFVAFNFCLIGLATFIGKTFPMFSDKRNTINYLLQPASVFEKLLSQFLLRIVLGTGVFLILFLLGARLAGFSEMQAESMRGNEIIIQPFRYDYVFNYMKIASANYFTPLISIALYLFSVRLFFKKHALLKTIISGAVLTLLIICFMVLMSHIFFPAETSGFNIKLSVNGDIILKYISIVQYILWGILLFMAYFKLKEKQS